MFNKKPRRNFRQRKASSSDEGEQQKASGDENRTEADLSTINKSSKGLPSRGLSCSFKRETAPAEADSSEEETTDLTGAGEETTENREEKNKKTSSVLSFSDDKEGGESNFQLKRSSAKEVLFQFKKKEASPEKTYLTKGSGSNPPSEESSDAASPQFVKFDVSGDSSCSDDHMTHGEAVSSSSSESNSNRSPPKPIVVSNAKEIRAARSRRRAIRAQKEFISLSRDGRSSNNSTPGHSSRGDEEDRIIDDDDDCEPDDHEQRIEFAPRLKSVRERIAEKLGGSDESPDRSDGEEQELWEETQIEKGLKRRPGIQSPSGSDSNCSTNSWRQRVRSKKRSTGIKIPETLPSVSVSMIKKKIRGKLDSLKEVHRARQAELRRIEGDVENARSSYEILEESSSEGQLKFYRSMILYIHNLVECLREKIVEINALELELHLLLSDQTEAVLTEIRGKIKEKAEHLQQLSYKTGEENGNSAQSSDRTCKTNSGLESEEETMNVPEDTQASAEEQELLQRRIDDILSRSKSVFSNVRDDFYDVKKILARFEEWRRSYAESYHNAYISLCLPKLLNPLIRHQLLSWDPLKESSSGEFESLPWFPAVETFCHGHDHEELEHTDRQTMSNIIEKTVLPKMTAFVELVWDPISCQQSSGLVSVCHRLKDDYSIFEGEQSKPVKGFIDAVIQKLRSCVDEDVFIPLYPTKCLEDKDSPQRLFRDQQFWRAVKLLGNMGRLDLVIPEEILKELMLDKLLNRYLMIALCSQTIASTSACKKIAELLPPSWFEAQSQCLPQLQNLRNHIVQNIHQISKQPTTSGSNNKSAAVENLKILSRIRCYDSIMSLAEKYHYQDAIYTHQLLSQETS